MAILGGITGPSANYNHSSKKEVPTRTLPLGKNNVAKGVLSRPLYFVGLGQHTDYNTMKRIGYILTEEKLSLDVCKTAIVNAAKHKHKRKSVIKILERLDEKAEVLRKIILEEKYKPAEYKVCHIIDHPSKKERLLHKPKFFPDQCVHHIIILLLREELMKRFDPYVIASIPKRGAHYGYKALRKWLERDKTGTKYCLKCDIKKCYDNIRPAVVVQAVGRFVKDKKFLRLVAKVAYSLPSLPLGNYTSGWFENLVLCPLDRALRSKKCVVRYLRYVDDFIVLGPNKRKLRLLIDFIEGVLAKLGLRLKDNWQVFKVDDRGIDIIGYRFFRKFVLLRRRNLLSLMRCIRAYKKHPTAKLARSLLSRIGMCKWFSSYNFWQKYCLDLNFKIIKRRAYLCV